MVANIINGKHRWKPQNRDTANIRTFSRTLCFGNLCFQAKFHSYKRVLINWTFPSFNVSFMTIYRIMDSHSDDMVMIEPSIAELVSYRGSLSHDRWPPDLLFRVTIWLVWTHFSSCTRHVSLTIHVFCTFSRRFMANSAKSPDGIMLRIKLQRWEIRISFQLEESPPAWTQEAYRSPRIKYSICCPVLSWGRGTLSLARVPPPPVLTWLRGYPILGQGTPHLDLVGVPPCLDLARVPPPSVPGWGIPPWEGTWDQSLGYPPRTLDQLKYYGMEMG